VYRRSCSGRSATWRRCQVACLDRKDPAKWPSLRHPRVTESDADESLDELETRRRNDAATAVLDVDDAVDSFKLPDADLSGRQICADCV
jgi:hypothetical protein